MILEEHIAVLVDHSAMVVADVNFMNVDFEVISPLESYVVYWKDGSDSVSLFTEEKFNKLVKEMDYEVRYVD